MDKAFTKLIVRSLKIPQADYFVFTNPQPEDFEGILKTVRYKLGYPCFVKPALGGSSVGITKAGNKKELEAALTTALNFSHKVIVEKAITGREIECAILGEGESAKASVPGEIIVGSEFYDYEAKYVNSDSQVRVPADLPADVAEKVKAYALQVFRAVDGRGLARADFFVEESGKVLFNEINTMPGFTNISMYPMLWEAEGISRQDLVEKLIEMAIGN
jgi:D-alanine-D-alanine ligase